MFLRIRKIGFFLIILNIYDNKRESPPLKKWAFSLIVVSSLSFRGRILAHATVAGKEVIEEIPKGTVIDGLIERFGEERIQQRLQG